ncbi:MAG: IS630 family transposase [bacterium]
MEAKRGTGRPRVPLSLSEHERAALESFARSRALPAGLVRRATMILLSVDGLSNTAIAERFATSVSLVSLWRQRYRALGLAGLYGEVRPGRPRSHDDDRIAALLKKTLQSRPPDATQWTVRALSQTTRMSKSSVHRYLTLFGVQPHRRRGFKLSTDPFFVEKVRDVVGLYLNPPDHALVLCVDEKSQVQALERTQPGLPLGLGYVQGITHDYYRHGTTTLFAALDVASGTVLSQCKPRHRHQEFLAFLRYLDAQIPSHLAAHLIVDNYATHKHTTVRHWLARHPRYQLHFTPTYASWLNQVERWFALITQRAIRRGSFTSVPQLVAKINHFVTHYNRHARPFLWTATADAILGKIERLCTVINGTQH